MRAKFGLLGLVCSSLLLSDGPAMADTINGTEVPNILIAKLSLDMPSLEDHLTMLKRRIAIETHFSNYETTQAYNVTRDSVIAYERWQRARRQADSAADLLRYDLNGDLTITAEEITIDL